MENSRIKELYRQCYVTFPSFCWMLFFFFLPTLFVLIFAFKSSDFYGNILEQWTLSNWFSLLQINYLQIIARTLLLSTAATAICLILSIPVGYYLALCSSRLKQLLLMLVIIPFWSSFLVRIFAWKSFLHPEGLLKTILTSLHLVSPETPLLYNSGAILLVLVYTYLPFGILPIYAASAKFDFHLIEAAQDLGSTRLHAFFKIFIPTIKKGIFTAAVMVLIPAVGAYVIPELVGGPSDEMIGNKIAQKVFLERNMPEASVLATFMALLILIPIAVGALMQKKAASNKLKGVN